MIMKMEEDSTVIIPVELLPRHQFKTSIFAREMKNIMSKKKEKTETQKLHESSDTENLSSNEIIMRLITCLSEDRVSSDNKFTAIFDELKETAKMTTRFKFYEKVLGVVCIAILYGLVDKFF